MIVAVPSVKYYREVWGFDPVTERKDLGHGNFRFERPYPLTQDPPLQAAGITMLARVDVLSNKSHNRIIFRRENNETGVYCTHTVVYKGTFEDAITLVEEMSAEKEKEEQTHRPQLGPQGRANLPPEEHFVALSSYAQSIAEMGISNLIRTAFFADNPATEGNAFGFNSAMQSQIIEALRSIAPQATASLLQDLCLEIAETVPLLWLMSRLDILEQRLHFREVIFNNSETHAAFTEIICSKEAEIPQDPEVARAIYGFFEKSSSPDARQSMAKNTNLPLKVARILAQFGDNSTRRSLSENEGLIPEILTLLANDPDSKIRVNVAKHKNLSPAILENLAKDKDFYVREEVAKQKNIPLEIIQRLAKDVDLRIRAYIIIRDDLPEEQILPLSKDPEITIRVAVARRSTLPLPILEALAKDPEPSVRYRIAVRRDLPEPLLRELILDHDWMVRLGLTLRTNLSPSARDMLSKDRDHFIRNMTTVLHPVFTRAKTAP